MQLRLLWQDTVPTSQYLAYRSLICIAEDCADRLCNGKITDQKDDLDNSIGSCNNVNQDQGCYSVNLSDFRPAREFALQFGVKAVVYGGPGSGKTPICSVTAPRACLVITEPGMLSMRKSDVPTFPAFNSTRFEEFVTWGTSSTEARNFDSFVIDSISQAAERKVDEELGTKTSAGNEQHGQRAYGKMSRFIMEQLNKLYFLPQKHIILITKLQNFELNGVMYKRPYFPGRELPVRVPHLFDLVTCLGDWNIPGVMPSPTKAFRTKEQFDMMGRDRSGNLLEYEPPNMSQLIAKCMA